MERPPLSLERAIEAAERWAILDPDPRTRSQIDRLVDAQSDDLVELFSGRLSFGTAGLRAAVGPGPNRMNAQVVRQTTAAVVQWLRAGGVAEPRVLVGFDARPDSADFAMHSAAVVRSLGGMPLLSSAAAPTPVFAHAALAEDAHAAVVVTASHNPPADNGYKLYLGRGLQIVAPVDEEIAALIDEIAASWAQFAAAIDDAFAELSDGSSVVDVDQWIEGHRADAVGALFGEARQVSVAYTAMHGVGGEPILGAFAQAGFPAPSAVAEQFEPDGQFPTVGFPNPEEPGAMDRVVAVAEATGADAAFANDPDADRLALAVPNRTGDAFVTLSGNQLGALLADHVLRHTDGIGQRIVARSVVSSRLLDSMARSHGVACEVTLTGFKWVARPILTNPDATYVFGFEEAIGYCVGSHVRDKDGVTAALIAAEALAELKAQGLTVWDRLDDLATEHGVHLTSALGARFDDEPQRVGELMQRIAANPPSALADELVVDSGSVGLGALPPTPGLHLLAANATQVIIRPSGTEPKVKAYIEVIEPVPSSAAEGGLKAAQARAAERLAAVENEVERLLA